MRWPWVTRMAFELVQEERDRLRQQCDRLLDQLTRIQRKDRGMSETPMEDGPGAGPVATGPMPEEIQRFIMGFASEVTRSQLTEEVRLLRQDHTWREIHAKLGVKAIEAEWRNG